MNKLCILKRFNNPTYIEKTQKSFARRHRTERRHADDHHEGSEVSDELSNLFKQKQTRQINRKIETDKTWTKDTDPPQVTRPAVRQWDQ